MSTTATPPAELGSFRPGLTIKRVSLLRELANGKSMREATEAVGMERESGYRAVEEMRAYLPKAMDDCGLDVRSILCRIREKVDAQETKFFQHEGRVVQTVDVEAHGIQLKALELAINLRPELAQRGQTNIGTVNILWAGPTPAWCGQAEATLAQAEANAVVTATLPIDTGVQVSTIEGTEAGPAPTAHTHSAKSASTDVLTQRVGKTVKKRKPRLPVYRGDK